MNRYLFAYLVAILAAAALAGYAFAHPSAGRADVVTLVGALIALAVAVIALTHMDQRTVYGVLAQVKVQPLDPVALAVEDCAREYCTVILLGYTTRDARSHLRAYINAKHDFLPDVRSTIARAAIIQATNHLRTYPPSGVNV